GQEQPVAEVKHQQRLHAVEREPLPQLAERKPAEARRMAEEGGVAARDIRHRHGVGAARSCGDGHQDLVASWWPATRATSVSTACEAAVGRSPRASCLALESTR